MFALDKKLKRDITLFLNATGCNAITLRQCYRAVFQNQLEKSSKRFADHSINKTIISLSLNSFTLNLIHHKCRKVSPRATFSVPFPRSPPYIQKIVLSESFQPQKNHFIFLVRAKYHVSKLSTGFNDKMFNEPFFDLYSSGVQHSV